MTERQRTPFELWAPAYRAQLVAPDGSRGPLVTVVQTLDGPVSVPDDPAAWAAAQVDRRDWTAVPLPR
jgi:hypothetical protein